VGAPDWASILSASFEPRCAQCRQRSESILWGADVDGDRHVTPFDALLILKYWAGVISTFPAGGLGGSRGQ
jgi:hypothetical protein